MTDKEIEFITAPRTKSADYLCVQRANRDDEHIYVNPKMLEIQFEMGRITLYKDDVLIKSYPAQLIEDIFWLE